MGTGGSRHWVLVETSGNQAYIFDTNRLRHVVGASYLVHQLGTAWVREAAPSCGAEVVLAISGKALLLVGDPEAGRAVIRAVSVRALAETPGLEVTGVVGSGFDPDRSWQPDTQEGRIAPGDGRPLTHVEALAGTYDLLEVAKTERPAALLRDPMLPWFEVCRDSGLPVAGIEQRPEGGYAASASVLAKSSVRRAARERMRNVFSGQPDIVPQDSDALQNDGWIAVIHADGNGIGQLFTSFAERALRIDRESGDRATGLTLDRHKELLAAFTYGLDLATETALDTATRDALRGQRETSGTILPVVFGGDDVTVVCHAGFALELARRFVLAFKEQTARQTSVMAIAGEPLTSSAGIAYVKPHHPFSAAYALAEELTASAKTARHLAGGEVSAVDFHVAFESTLAELTTLRRRAAAGGLPRHGGPYTVTTEDDAVLGPRDVAQLDRAKTTISRLSSSMAHDLREALGRGSAEFEQRLDMAALSTSLPGGVRPDDIRHLAPLVDANGPAGNQVIVRFLDALLLNAITGMSPLASSGGSGDEQGVTAGALR